MRNPIKNLLAELGSSFSQVQGNARVIVLLHPVWTITFSLYSPYLSLYMIQLGCSMEQVGLINAIGMLFGAVIALFAGWLTDRMGRRRACLIADIICWAVACLLWGLAQNFLWFLAAVLANAFLRLIAVSWNCAVAEGTAPENRMTVYWWLNIMGTVAVFATPLMGLWMDRNDPDSLIPVMRVVLLVSSAILCISFIIRHRFLKELPIGLERMQAARKETPLAALKAFIPMFTLLKGSPLLLLFISIRSIYYVQMGLRGTYLPVTVVKGLGFTNDVIGMISLISGVVMLLAQFLLLPKLRSLPPARTLFVSMSALIVSSFMLVLSPASSFVILILSSIISAAGAFTTGMLVDTCMANILPDADRAPLLAFMTILTVMLSAPFMWLGGWLAGLPAAGPRLPMLLLALLIAACMVLLGLANKAQKKADEAQSLAVADVTIPG